ncbi:MAG TPA: acetylxylan esterase [Planctomycetota bacterium]|nr:acetylxylan esterase [Planctomycetota bacterium]
MNHPYADIRTFDFRGMLQRDLLELSRVCFEDHAARIAALKSAHAALSYQREKRALIAGVIGGVPQRIRQSAFRKVRRIDPRETRPQIVGSSDHDGVTIQRMVFQSTPGTFVTALLHRPQTPAPRHGRPAVVFVCGHSDLAKHYPPYLAVQRELALNGFVVLAIDPHGQGERQYIPPFRNGSALFGSVEQHFIAGLRADLSGCNIARWFIADIQSAVDVLGQVPEVDPKRIGLTGASGGGTQTAYAMALDTRIAAAAPCVYITDREQYLQSGQMHDHEQNFFRAISAGVCHHDFLSLMAPRPLVVLSGRGDFFPIEGARLSVARARHVYNLFKAGRNLEHSITEERHAYSALHRHKAVEFFRKHLGPAGLVGRKPICRNEFETLPYADIHVTQSGQWLAEEPRAVSLPKLVAARPRLARLPAAAAGTLAARRRKVADAAAGFWNLTDRLANLAHRPVDPRSYDWPEHKNPAVRDTFFFTEARAAVFVREFTDPTQTAAPTDAVVVIPGKTGVQEFSQKTLVLFRALAQSGIPVLVVCPRGIGPNRCHSVAQDGDTNDEAMNYTERTMIMNYQQLGSPLAALQASDIANALSRPRSPLYERYHNVRLHLTGCGPSGVIAALAALWSPVELGSLRVGSLFGSFGAVVDGPPMALPEDWNLFGLLQFADLPQLYALANAAAVHVVNPLAADGVLLNPGAARAEILLPYEKCRGRGARAKLALHCQVPAPQEWPTLLGDLQR